MTPIYAEARLILYYAHADVARNHEPIWGQ